MKQTGIELIAQERQEQIEIHGKTPEYDHKNNRQRQLPIASAILTNMYCITGLQYTPIFWDEASWRKMYSKSYIQRLTMAGALIAAEIDRVQLDNELYSQTLLK